MIFLEKFKNSKICKSRKQKAILIPESLFNDLFRFQFDKNLLSHIFIHKLDKVEKLFLYKFFF